ncbi:MAG TPA: DNA repair exonuclease [Candidatus Eisenbacteria bacterium]|nr:DNA repair exonuclease [Candidatus Eisenbacteria bacterium]
MSTPLRLSFLQISDVHLGRPFGWLPPEKRAVRRDELKEIWRRAIEEAIARRVDAVLVPGDLFDGEEADVETVNRAIECASARGCPPIYVAPGNHDCFSRANHYYDNVKLRARRQPAWPDHVTIFTTPEIETAPLARPDVRFWGRCVHANVDSSERVLATTPALDKRSANVLLLHGSRDGFLRPGKRLTAPFSDAEILRAGFDYVALGHYHEYAAIVDENGRARAAYSGSPAALAKDEAGARGAIHVRLAIDLDAGPGARLLSSEIEPVVLDERRLHEVKIDLSGVGSREAARERTLAALEAAEARPRDLVIARYTGQPLPGVEAVPRAEDLGERVWFFAADASAVRPAYDLAAYRRGEPRTTEERFARSLLAEIEDEKDPERRAVLEAALYYGLDALRQQSVAPRYEWGLE